MDLGPGFRPVATALSTLCPRGAASNEGMSVRRVWLGLLIALGSLCPAGSPCGISTHIEIGECLHLAVGCGMLSLSGGVQGEMWSPCHGLVTSFQDCSEPGLEAGGFHVEAGRRLGNNAWLMIRSQAVPPGGQTGGAGGTRGRRAAGR